LGSCHKVKARELLDGSPTGQDTSCIELCDSAFLFTRTRIKTASSNGAYASSQQTTKEGLDAMATNDPRAAAAAAAPVPTKVMPIRENTPEKAELIRLFESKKWDKLPPENSDHDLEAILKKNNCKAIDEEATRRKMKGC
jgi:hypothetical protein